METEGVKVIMVSLALQGHINPMLKLAKVLVSKGIHVTIATNDVARKRMLDSMKTSNGRLGLNLEFFSDGLSHDFDRDNDTGTFIASLKKNGPTNLSNLIADLKAKGNKYSCLISSPFITWVPGVASEHGIPCSVLWIQSSTVFSIYYHGVKNPKLFPNLENPNGDIELPGLKMFKVGDLPTFILPSALPHFRQWVVEFISVLDKVKWVLGNSVFELEEEIVNSISLVKTFYPIGPLVSPFLLGKKEAVVGNVDMWSAEDSCIEWLDKQSPASIGVRMRNGEDGKTLSVDDVERCIKEVMDGPRAEEMKKRAMELKAIAMKALDYGGSSDRNIDKFISEISGKTFSNGI
ncbi:UDP-glucuronosyl/UDP-glucosyltransferase [Corchorus olitorius]|uniref:UDP-glucuronosyl/UDP-glucosyltransferase n=1 Tax=Corchorus olitorius TaxID=93759 RepID=A0A1R3K495_9ROSI|nr:UDP-glucuronosyl/UDP-glucosyltransferase [Corchorus olitorius]